jgi:hypothetical protein
MKFDTVYLFIVAPLILNVLAILLYRGLFRVLAACFLVPIGCSVACDVYSASKEGNLTGIITILIPVLIIGIVGIFIRVPLNWGKRSSRREESSQPEEFQD